MLIARGRLKHQYPHSWRSKKPVIFRNTPQWFISLDYPISNARRVVPIPVDKNDPLAFGEDGEEVIEDTLRQRALDSIAVTRWVPPQGQNRITGMIESRPDWVISRQRAWGVPITVFVREKGDGSVEMLEDARVNERIAAAFEQEGADAWYAAGAARRFLEPEYDANEWRKVDDILDVWFDSGSTHAFTLEKRPDLMTRRAVDGGPDTIMYLEGSDQHRGWFQSSLLESCGTRGRAPFDVVLTHGFVLDEAGRKMSKSLGNVTAPQDVIRQSGADILRMWVCASDYADDLRIGPEILKTTVERNRRSSTVRQALRVRDEIGSQ
jgi:isoleucyl-tRNA synthetase